MKHFTSPALLKLAILASLAKAGYRDAVILGKPRYVSHQNQPCLEIYACRYTTTSMPLELLHGYERALRVMPGVIATRIVSGDGAGGSKVNPLRDQVVVTHLRIWDEP